jgi:hypothetical protein
MFKEHGPPKESARNKAERRWKNAELRKQFKQAKQRPRLVDPNKEPEIAETITNEGKRDESVQRFERRFLKDIRAMMEGHVNRNLAIYAATIELRRRKLLKEKLRRLQAAQQNQGGKL